MVIFFLSSNRRITKIGDRIRISRKSGTGYELAGNRKDPAAAGGPGERLAAAPRRDQRAVQFRVPAPRQRRRAARPAVVVAQRSSAGFFLAQSIATTASNRSAGPSADEGRVPAERAPGRQQLRRRTRRPAGVSGSAPRRRVDRCQARVRPRAGPGIILRRAPPAPPAPD